jgi:hypothetical protein
MVNRPLREAIKKATGGSDRTVRKWLLAIEKEHLLTREQAELVLAYQRGVDIRKYVSKDGLEEVRRVVREQAPPVPAPTVVGIREAPRVAPRATPTPREAEAAMPIVCMENKDVTEFLRKEFQGYTRSKVGKRLKKVCDTREDLRQILLHDVSDAVRCYAHRLWKSCAVLCGGAIEGILTSLLESRLSGELDNAYTKVRKSQQPKPLKDYTLEDKLDVAEQLGILVKGSASYGHGARKYRNYVHPAEELKIGYPLGQRDARIALELVLKILDEVGK